MVIDQLSNAKLYRGLGPAFIKAFEYLQHTDFGVMEKGKYEIDGQRLFVRRVLRVARAERLTAPLLIYR